MPSTARRHRSLRTLLIHIDKNGNVIGSFDASIGHGMDVDSQGFVYIGQDTVRKYDPKTGRQVAMVARVPEQESGSGGGTAGNAPGSAPARVPGRGSAGPLGTFPPQPAAGRGAVDQAALAAARAAFRAKYPPSTPMIVGGIEEIRLDEAASEMYVADNISDLTNNHIWFLNREDGRVVGQMGSMGENGGQWFGLHMIAVDSKGNIYTGEVFNGERVQRFVPAR